mmetsp:Transcript_11579/g.46807  ORF Transcript_11579/g.46807 Transcript_11579/m.46807 type:complete len:266 (+) Transcript_11579:1045-1842(+)
MRHIVVDGKGACNGHEVLLCTAVGGNVLEERKAFVDALHGEKTLLGDVHDGEGTAEDCVVSLEEEEVEHAEHAPPVAEVCEEGHEPGRDVHERVHVRILEVAVEKRVVRLQELFEGATVADDASHAADVILPNALLVQHPVEQPEGLRFLLNVEKHESSDVGHALAVADLLVVVGICQQHAPQPLLAFAAALPVGRVRRERPVDVQLDLVAVLVRAAADVLVVDPLSLRVAGSLHGLDDVTEATPCLRCCRRARAVEVEPQQRWQ